MVFKDQKEADKWLDEAVSSAKGYRAQLARDMGINRCYYEGMQWLSQGGYSNNGTPPQLTRLFSNYNPDTNKLRVTVNRTTRFCIKAAAATSPEKIYADVIPAEQGGSIAELGRAQTLESLLNLSVDQSNYLDVRRDANMSRSIVGTAGVGLHIKSGTRRVVIDGQEQEMPTKELIAFEFDPARLILDPNRTSRSLANHDYVVYRDVWTKEKLKREFNVDLPDKDLTPIGQLATVETTLATFTNGRMYARYLQYAKTPGAIVYQVHCKGETGNFDYMYVVVETAAAGRKWVNLDNPHTPFGGNGLPLELLHGHRRPDSPWSIGDVAMMRDDQDKLSLTASLVYRMLQKNAGYQVVIDKRTIPKGVSDDEMAGKFSNSVAGLISIDMGRREENRTAPSIMQYPTAPPQVNEMMRESSMEMREQTFRSEGNFGTVKTHVPDASYQASLNQADQVAGLRVSEDVRADARLLSVMLGTQIRHVQEGSAGTLAALTRNGFDQDDFVAIVNSDPVDPAVSVTIRESSVRYRSPTERKQDMVEAIQLQAISPSEYRFAMADDLDTPATRSDRALISNIRKLIARTVAGQPWQPVALGMPAGAWAVDEMRQEMLNCMRMGNQQAAALLNQGIQGQLQIDAPPAPMVAQGAGAEPDQDEQMPATIGDLYNKMAGAGSAA